MASFSIADANDVTKSRIHRLQNTISGWESAAHGRTSEDDRIENVRNETNSLLSVTDMSMALGE